MRIRDALQQAREQGVERLDAQLMLARLFEQPRAWLLAHDDAALDVEQVSRWAGQLQRRAGGEPLAYVIGQAEFRGMELQVYDSDSELLALAYRAARAYRRRRLSAAAD